MQPTILAVEVGLERRAAVDRLAVVDQHEIARHRVDVLPNFFRVQSFFELRKGELEHSVGEHESFKLILANIHRNVLMVIADGIAIRTESGGHIILSGLLIYDAEDVRAKYESAGFTFVQQLQENEWVAIVMQKQ